MQAEPVGPVLGAAESERSLWPPAGCWSVLIRLPGGHTGAPVSDSSAESCTRRSETTFRLLSS